MIFETHAHYNDAKFDTDREAVLAELPESGVSPVINVGDSIRSTKETLALAGIPFFMPQSGYTPAKSAG